MADAYLAELDPETKKLKLEHAAPRTLAALDKAFVVTTDGGADPTGTVSSTAAFQAAYDSSATHIWVPTGTYLIGQVTYIGVTKHMRTAPGVKFIQSAASGMFDLRGGWDYLGAIESTSVEIVDLIEPGPWVTPSTSLTRATQLKLTDPAAAPVQVGDIVKVVSDDIQATGRDFAPTPATGSNSRSGEYSMVGLPTDQDNPDLIQLTNILIDPYTTNPRVARLRDVSFTFEGAPTFDSLPSIRDASVYGAVVSFRAAKFCSIGPKTKFLNSMGRAVANYTYCSVFDGITYHNLDNRPWLGHYGYGVQDCGHQTVMRNCRGSNLRHMYSEGGGVVGANSSYFEFYGGGWYGQVSNCTATACQSQPFDTHGTAYGTVFTNCHAFGSFNGANSGGYGFVARGRRIRFIGCTTDASFRGFGVSSGGTRLEQCVARSCFYSGLQITGDLDDAIRVTDLGEPIIVDGCLFEARTPDAVAFLGLTGYSMKIEIRNTTFRSLAPTNGGDVLRVAGGTDLRLRNVVFDLTQSTSAFALNGVRVTDNGIKLRIRDLDVRGGSAPFTGFNIVNSSSSTNGGGAGVVEAIDVRFQHDSISPTILHNSLTARRGTWRTEVGAAVVSSAFQSVAATAGLVVAVGDRADQHVNVKLTGAGGVTLGAFPSGAFPSQRMSLLNTTAATITTAAGTAITAGSAVTFVWDGTNWLLS